MKSIGIYEMILFDHYTLE